MKSLLPLFYCTYIVMKIRTHTQIRDSAQMDYKNWMTITQPTNWVPNAPPSLVTTVFRCARVRGIRLSPRHSQVVFFIVTRGPCNLPGENKMKWCLVHGVEQGVARGEEKVSGTHDGDIFRATFSPLFFLKKEEMHFIRLDCSDVWCVLLCFFLPHTVQVFSTQVKECGGWV
jgi:hypothetical protein